MARANGVPILIAFTRCLRGHRLPSAVPSPKGPFIFVFFFLVLITYANTQIQNQRWWRWVRERKSLRHDASLAEPTSKPKPHRHPASPRTWTKGQFSCNWMVAPQNLAHTNQMVNLDYHCCLTFFSVSHIFFMAVRMCVGCVSFGIARIFAFVLEFTKDYPLQPRPV